jgi:hypothetical protein
MLIHFTESRWSGDRRLSKALKDIQKLSRNSLSIIEYAEGSEILQTKEPLLQEWLSF